jgi:autotransporter-associated beta strand protein
MTFSVRARGLRSRLLLSACFVALPSVAQAQNTTVSTTRTTNLNMDADDTLTVTASGSFQVAANRAVTINGTSSGTGVAITNDGTIEAVPTATNSGGRAISGSTDFPDRTVTITNRGTVRAGNDAIQMAESTAGGDAGLITIINSGTILSTGLDSNGAIGQQAQGVDVAIAGVTLNLTNQIGGTITGSQGVLSTATTVIGNAGTITGTGAFAGQGEGVRAHNGATLNLTNEATGTITGVYGVIATGNAVIVNRGTISGGSGGNGSPTREAIRVNLSATSTLNSVTLAAGSTTTAGTGAGGTGNAVVFGGSPVAGTVNTLTIETGAIINGTIAGAGNANATDILNLTGTGSQVLVATSNFDTLNVVGGTWGIVNAQAPVNGTTIAAGATLRYDDFDATTGGQVSGGIVNNGTLIHNRTRTVTQDAAIIGTGGVQIINTGSLVLAAGNTWSGDTIIANGRLRTGTTDNSFSAASAVIVTGDGVLDLSGVSGGSDTGNGTNQTIANLSGNGSVRTGTLTGGTLTTGAGGGDTIFSGIVNGLGGITKTGSGTMTLSGNNTATGLLSVDAGGVILSGRWSGAATLASGTNLTGAGRIYGILTVADATIAPGNEGVGTLTTDGLVLSAGSVLDYQLGAPGTGDRIQVNGNLTLDGTLDIADVGGFGEGVYRLINYTGALTDNGLLLGNIPGGANSGLMTIQTSVTTQVNLVYGTPAATMIQFWDGGDITGNAAIDGGSGSWTNALPNWTDTNGASNTGWASAFGVFQGAAGTVTVDDAIVFTGAQFITEGYTIAAGTGTLTTNSALTNIRVDPGVTATISAGVGGTGGLLKNDAGTLILSGANTYAGGTTILGGTVAVLGGSAIPTTSNVTVAAAGTLDIRADQAVGGLNGAGNVLLSGGTLTTGAIGVADSFTGTLSGAGGVTKTGTGTTTLSGANDYAGETSVLQGTLALANGGKLGSGALNVANGATANLAGQSNSVGALSGGGAILLGTNGALTSGTASTTSFDGTITGAGASLTHTGSGTLILDGTANDFGVLNVTSGRVVAGAAGALGGSTVVAVGGGSLELGANQGIAALNGAGDVALGGNRLTVSGTANSSYTGVASGNGGITKAGTGTLTLGGANSYTGITQVTGGTLALDGSVAGGIAVTNGAMLSGGGNAAGVVTLADGAALEIGGAGAGIFTSGGLGLSSGSALNFGLGAASVAGASDRIQVNGDLTLDGTLNVTNLGGFGAGVYRLIDYSGTLTDNGLDLGILPSGANRARIQVQTTVGAQINLVVADSLPEIQFWDGGQTSANGAVDGGAGSWTNARTNWTDANGGSNDGWGGRFAVFQGTAGTVTVDDAIEFSGMQFMADGYVIAAGTGSLNAIEAQTNIRVDPGVTATIGAAIGGVGGLNKLDTGTLILTGTNNYAGTTTVAGGTLRAGGAGALPAGTAVTVAAGATLDIAAAQTIGSLAGDGSVTLSGGGLTTGGANADTRFAGVISGGGGLTKTGSGSFTLAGTNSYTGGTSIAAGILRLDGGTLGTGALAITGGATFDMNGGVSTVAGLSGTGSLLLGSGTLTVDGANASDFGGVISGSGSFVKAGTGNLTLSGANTYTGATSVRAGTLTLNAGAVPAAASISLDAGATLALGGAVTLGTLNGAGSVALDANTLSLAGGDYTGVIAGAGGLAKTGANALTLGGVSTYTGATTVSGGTLAIGAGGSIAGSSGVTLASGARFDIAAATAAQTINGLTGVAGSSVALGVNRLTVNNANANSFAGTVGGTGSLGKSGSGTLTLTGANTYSGGTFVTGGVLAAGATNVFGSGVLSVTAPGSVTLGTFAQTVGGLGGDGNINLGTATLTVNGSASSAYAGTLAGTGRLTKLGTGTLTLSGANTYTGSTTITEGLLVVNGSLAGSVSIGANGRLGGSGKIGALTVTGTAAPGNSIGTLNVTGNLTFAAGSRYQVEVAPNGTSDLIAATGTITLQGGTVSVLTGVNTAFLPLTTYTILTGASVTGAFAGVTTDLAFLAPSLVYNAASVQLRLLRNDVSFTAVGETANQKAIAAALAPQSSGAVYDAVIGLNAADARDAFDQLSGEVFVAGASVASRDSHDAAREMIERIDGPRGQSRTAWMAGNIGQLKTDADSGFAAIKSNRKVIEGGVEFTGDHLRYGFAYRYARNDISLAVRRSTGDMTTNSGYGYIGYTAEGFRAAGGLGFAAHTLSTDRQIAIGNLANSLSAATDGSSIVGFGDIAYLAPLGGAVRVGPYFGTSVTVTTFEAIEEWGGAAALRADRTQQTTALASYGLRGTGTFGGVTLSGDVGARSYLGNATDTRRFSFVDTGASFEAGAGQFGKTTLTGRLDASIEAGRLLLGLGLRGETAGRTSSYGVRASAGFRF